MTGELTLFYIDFDNQLQYISNDIGWTNMGATTHEGVELAFSYDLSELNRVLNGVSVYSSYTYTKASTKSGDFAGKDLPFYSRQVYTVGTRYETGNWVWNLDSYAQSQQRSPGLAHNTLRRRVRMVSSVISQVIWYGIHGLNITSGLPGQI